MAVALINKGQRAVINLSPAVCLTLENTGREIIIGPDPNAEVTTGSDGSIVIREVVKAPSNAEDVKKIVRGWLFSKRRQFLEELQFAVSERFASSSRIDASELPLLLVDNDWILAYEEMKKRPQT